jgi:hypothetical protein
MAAPTGTTASYVYQGDGTSLPSATLLGGTTKEISLQWSSATGGLKFVFNAADKSALKISSGFSGDVKVLVRVWRVDNNAVVWDESATITIARVVSANVTVTAAAASTVTVGTGKDAAAITIQENVPGAIPQGKEIYVVLLTSGAKFSTSGCVYDAIGINNSQSNQALTPSDNGAKLTILINNASSGIAGKVIVKAKLDVPPVVTGDIQVKVLGSSGSNIPETVLTIAKVGQGAYGVAVEQADKQVVYQGQSADLTTDLVLKAQAGGVLPLGAYVTFEFSGNPSSSVVNFVYKGVYNDGRAIWFAVENNSITSDVKITDLKVVVSPAFAIGDLTVTVGGNAGVSGTVVIAQVKSPLTVTAAEKPEIKPVGENQAAGKIVIKEAAAGALKGGKTITLTTPYGVAFSGTPTVKVTEGNLGATAASPALSSDGRTFTINVTGTSTVASAIEISNIKYATDSRAAYGDVVLNVGGTINEFNSDPIAKVANATIAAPAPPTTKREAKFVIGDNLYTINGEEYVMDVVPYVKNNRTYVPLRYAAVALGVDEENIFYSNGVVTLLKGGRAVQVTIGSKALVVNGVTIQMDVAPELSEGRTMLPFRWIATALGASVSWDEETKTVTMVVE